MPMQISFDELISMMISRLDGLAMSDENTKSRSNIVTRVLYKKGLITDADIIQSIREEHRILKELGLIQEEPADDMVNAVAESILLWIKGDVPALKKSMEDYEKKLQDAMSKQTQKPKIDVASPAVLQQLNRMGGPQQGGGKKIIL